MSEKERKPKTFGSASDLPKIRELQRLLDGSWRIRFLLKSAQREKLEQLKAELLYLSDVVDKFYDLLGNRNWVFHGDMNMPAMGEVVAMETPGQAEERLIDYYKDEQSLDFLIGRLWRVEALRPRHELIIRASEDYRAGRYYSTVLVLIAVMDGAVNDLEPDNRRGLHTRKDHEMVAWDSVTAHHLSTTAEN